MQHNRFYKLSVFDPRRAESQVASNAIRAKGIFNVLANIIQDGVRPVEKITRALIRGDTHQCQQIIDTLKSSVSNFGAMRVCDICSDLTSLLQDAEHKSQIIPLIAVLQDELEAFLQQAQEWLICRREQYKDKSHKSLEFHFIQFQQKLVQCQFSALDDFESLKEYLSNYLKPADLIQLDNALQQLDFRTALHLTGTVPQCKKTTDNINQAS